MRFWIFTAVLPPGAQEELQTMGTGGGKRRDRERWTRTRPRTPASAGWERPLALPRDLQRLKPLRQASPSAAERVRAARHTAASTQSPDTVWATPPEKNGC